MHVLIKMKIKIKIELKNEFLILILDRLGGTHEGGYDTDVKTGGYALQGDMHLCRGAMGGVHVCDVCGGAAFVLL